MAERIITADEARRLREAATPGPWRVTDADSVAPRVGGAWPVAFIPGDHDDRPWDCGGDEPIEPLPLADAELIAAAPDLAWTVEQLTAERDRLDLMHRCELGDETAAPGYAEALAAYESDPDEDEFCPPWFFDGDWHHADSGLDLHRFIDVDCGVFWSTFTTDPDTGAWEPCGPKYRSALDAMEAIGAGVYDE